MNDIATVVTRPAEDSSGTRASQFLVRRGVLLLKEMKTLGEIKDLHGSKLKFGTLVLTVAKSGRTAEEVTYSARLEQSKEHSDETALIDFDELEELDRALGYIDGAAKKIEKQKREYTELVYITKDSLVFGLYQGPAVGQMFFFKINSRNHFYLPPEQIAVLREHFHKVREYLVFRGAT